ncbi:MAG: RDD family protein [Solirubrobacteraceae bacterium]
MPEQDVIGRRIGAAAIDIALVFVLYVVVAAIFGERRGGSGTNAVIRLEGAGFLLFLLLTFLYYWRTEAMWGQTLGKRWLGLKVVGEDGAPATSQAVLVRNLLRPIDGLPAFYLVGFVVAMTNPRRQRIGDLVAHTLVVAVTAPLPPPPEEGPSDDEVLAEVLGR